MDAADFGFQFFLLFLFQFKEFGPQVFQAHFLILQLRPFILALDDDARRHVGHADSRTRLVDVLAAGTGGAEVIDADVVHVDFDIDIIRQFRHDIDSRKGRVAPGCSIKRRNADQAMDAFFRFQIAIGVFTFDAESGALDARFIAGLHIQDSQFIAIAFGPAGIHADEHLRPVLGFRTAGTGVEGNEGVALVVFAGQEEPHFPLLDILEQVVVLLFNIFGKGSIAVFHGHFQILAEVVSFADEFFVTFDFRLEKRRFLGNLLGLIRVIPEGRVTHLHV